LLTRSTFDYISEYVGYKARRAARGLSRIPARADLFYEVFHRLGQEPLEAESRDRYDYELLSRIPHSHPRRYQAGQEKDGVP
jgi:hypothetical protein